MNDFDFGGRFVRDPELKETNGTKYVFFTLAQGSTTKNGEKKGIFIPFTAFGQTAEGICKFFKKGSPIYVSGRFSSSTTEGDGKDTKITHVSQIVTHWEFPLSNKNADSVGVTTDKAPVKAVSATVDNAPAPSDDLPF